MNKVKRLAKKRMYMQEVNNSDVAEMLSDTRKINVPRTFIKDGKSTNILRDKEAIRQDQNANWREIYVTTKPDFTLGLTFAEKRRRQMREAILSNNLDR